MKNNAKPEVGQAPPNHWWVVLILFLPTVAVHGMITKPRFQDVFSQVVFEVVLFVDCVIAWRALWGMIGGEPSRWWFVYAILYVAIIPIIYWIRLATRS